MSTSGDTANINPIVSAYAIRSQNTLAPFYSTRPKEDRDFFKFLWPSHGWTESRDVQGSVAVHALNAKRQEH